MEDGAAGRLQECLLMGQIDTIQDLNWQMIDLEF